MITVSRYDFNRTILDNLADEIRFPLTKSMCAKNNYERWKHPPMMQVTYEQENPENVLSIVIYSALEEGKVRIHCLEVESSHRSQFWGRRALDRFMLDETVREIKLTYLPEAKTFYEKMKFHETGESEMTWTKRHEELSNRDSAIEYEHRECEI